MAKVSIIVPIYNVEEYLPKCLDRLISQTIKDIEILDISDGSPDNSLDIIKKYAEKDNRIKCIEKENGGYGSVLKYAISNISSEYFLICDPDDWLAPEAIEKLYNIASEKQVDLVVGAKNLVYSDNEEIVYDASKNKNVNLKINALTVYNKENGVEKALFLTPSPHSKLYKTTLAKDIEFPHKVSFTDFLLYTVFLTKCQSFVYTDEALSYYLVDRPGNTMTDVKPKVFDYHATVFKSTMEQIENCQVKYMYSHMIDHLRYILKEYKYMPDVIAKKDKKDQIYQLVKLCQKHRVAINRESAIFPSRVALYNKLMLNPIIGKIFFNRFVR